MGPGKAPRRGPGQSAPAEDAGFAPEPPAWPARGPLLPPPRPRERRRAALGPAGPHSPLRRCPGRRPGAHGAPRGAGAGQWAPARRHDRVRGNRPRLRTPASPPNPPLGRRGVPCHPHPGRASAAVRRLALPALVLRYAVAPGDGRARTARPVAPEPGSGPRQGATTGSGQSAPAEDASFAPEPPLGRRGVPCHPHPGRASAAVRRLGLPALILRYAVAPGDGRARTARPVASEPGSGPRQGATTGSGAVSPG